MLMIAASVTERHAEMNAGWSVSGKSVDVGCFCCFREPVDIKQEIIQQRDFYGKCLRSWRQFLLEDILQDEPLRFVFKRT